MTAHFSLDFFASGLSPYVTGHSYMAAWVVLSKWTLITSLLRSKCPKAEELKTSKSLMVSKVMSALFNALSRLVMGFLPGSKHLLIAWLQSPSAVVLEPKKINSVTPSAFSPSICHEVIGQVPWSHFFECWVFSQLFHSPLSLSSRGSLVPLHFLP